MSEKVEDLALLPSVKEELLTYMRFGLLYGENQLLSGSAIKDLENKQEKGNFNEIKIKIHKIILTLDRLHQDQTRKEIASFLDLIQTLPTPSEIKQAIYLLGIQLIHYVIKNSQSKNDITLINELLHVTDKLINLKELKMAVMEWCKKVLAIMKDKNDNQSIDSIDLAKKWIGEHLDKNITIQKIALQVHMNPTYFSEYFKAQTGETILDYVTRIRIGKAKELLLSTDLKIYDISVEVGYTDTKYFSKLFKKYYGEVPSKFRERLLYEHN
jgi:two-component system, response regulator YesN